VEEVLRVIITYVGGTVAFLLLLAFSDSNIIGVGIGFAVLTAAGAWLFEPAIVRFRRVDRQLRWRMILKATRDQASEYWREISNPEYSSSGSFGNTVEAWLFLLAGVLMSLVGLSILSSVLPTPRFVGMVAGSLMMAGAWLLWRRYGRQRRVWRQGLPSGRMEGGHAAEVLLYVLASPLLAVFGFYLLATAL
jgi:hypothetical protein